MCYKNHRDMSCESKNILKNNSGVFIYHNFIMILRNKIIYIFKMYSCKHPHFLYVQFCKNLFLKNGFCKNRRSNYPIMAESVSHS